MKTLTLSILLLFMVSYHCHGQSSNATLILYFNSTPPLDQSSNSYTVELNGNAGIINSGLHIPMDDESYLSIDATALHGLSDFTISTRVKFDEFNQTGSQLGINAILSGSNSTQANAFIFAYVDSKSLFEITIDNNKYEVEDISLDTGVFYCLSVTRENNLVKFYIDGQLQGSGQTISNSINISGDALIIGQEQDCYNGCFIDHQSLNGVVDNLKIFDIALSQSDLLNTCSDTSCKKLILTFNDPTVTDLSDNNYSVTLYGSASVNSGYLTIPKDNTSRVEIDGDALTGLTDFTLSTRVKFNAFNTSGSPQLPTNTIISGSNATNDNELVFAYIHSNSIMEITLNGNKYEATNVTLDTGVFYYLDVVRDNSQVDIYIDGQVQGAGKTITNSINITDTHLIIGQEQDCEGGCFIDYQSLNGVVDFLTICSEANPVESFFMSVPTFQNTSYPYLIDIFPNPSSGRFHLNSNVKIKNIEVYNIQGQLINSTFSLNTLIIPEYSNGIYYVRIHSDEKVITKRVLLYHAR